MKLKITVANNDYKAAWQLAKDAVMRSTTSLILTANHIRVEASAVL